ncbi:MAG TPA: FliH/SctL family protein [Bryobacteraceae bacterium]|nr:FliH/SctL family protein [Bryobacteraceae bacterium]
MSSRLMRGDSIATEPVAWRRVSSTEAITGDGQPAAGYISEPGIPSGSDSRKDVDIEQRLLDAHQKSFEEGQAAGRQSRTPEVEAMQVKLARSIEELTGARPRYRREAERDVVALALAIARRILHRELTVAPEALLGLVKAALDKLEARELHQVRVSRQDAPMIRQFFEQMGLPHRVEVLADPNLVPGSVILESSRGLLDASVDTQLAEIDRGLADLVP